MTDNNCDLSEVIDKSADQSGSPAPEKEEKTAVVGVIFRSSPKAYYFAPGNLTPAVGDAVIVETVRGTEYGKIKFARREVPTSDIVPPLRPLLRIATAEDIERHEANRAQEKYAMQVCREKIAAHKLDMNLVDAAYTFDNRKLYFYFTSEARVDFRDLVKDLASVFKVRIDLRQIGIRDEAKMLGGLGPCGRPFCCSGFLSDFVQVSIKMAKEQNFSLNSSKISGSCGRLMCCLRYESDTYSAALKRLPPIGSLVSTPAGNGTVVEVKPLNESVRVRLDDKEEQPKFYSIEDITVIRSGKKNDNKPPRKTENEKNDKNNKNKT